MPKGYKLIQKPKIICVTCGNVKEVRDNWTAKKRKFCSRMCRRHTELAKETIRQKKIGQRVHSEEWKNELRERMKHQKYALGHKLSEEHIEAIREAHKGSKSYFWKDGRSYDKNRINWQKNEWHRRKRKAQGHHTFEEWEALKSIHDHKCNFCKKKVKLTEDHIIPLSKGGTNDIKNIQPLCLKCNLTKHNKLPSEIR